MVEGGGDRILDALSTDSESDLSPLASGEEEPPRDENEDHPAVAAPSAIPA